MCSQRLDFCTIDCEKSDTVVEGNVALCLRLLAERQPRTSIGTVSLNVT